MGNSLGDLRHSQTLKKTKKSDEEQRKRKRQAELRNARANAVSNSLNKGGKNRAKVTDNSVNKTSTKADTNLKKGTRTERTPLNKNHLSAMVPTVSPTKDKQHHMSSLGKTTKANYEKAQSTYSVPRFNRGVVRGAVNNSLPGNIYSLATGKKLKDYTETEKKYGVDKSKVANVGEMVGATADYLVDYGSTVNLATKATTKVLSKSGAKKVINALSKKVGKETAEKVVKGATRNLIQDATVGTAKDLASGRGEGLEGKDLAKYMGTNAALNLAVGGVAEGIPIVKEVYKKSPRAINKASQKMRTNFLKSADNANLKVPSDNVDVKSMAQKLEPLEVKKTKSRKGSKKGKKSPQKAIESPQDIRNIIMDEKFQNHFKEKYNGKTASTLARENGTSVENVINAEYKDFKTPKKGNFEVTKNSFESPDVKFLNDAIDNGKGTYNNFYKYAVSGQAELEKLGKDSINGHTQAVRNSKGTVNYIFNDKLVDPSGKVINETSYKKLIESIPKDKRKPLNDYMLHLRNIERWDQGTPVFKQTSKEESKQIVDELLKSNPELEKYAKEMKTWWNDFTGAWVRDTGRMAEDSYDNMLLNNANYMPTKRVGKTNGLGSGVMGNKANSGKAFHKAVGGTSEVISFEDGFLNEMDRIVTSTRKNDLYADIINTLKEDPEKTKMYGVVIGDAENVKSSSLDDFLDKVEQEGLKEVNDKVASLTAYIDGKPVTAYINKNMLYALKTLEDGMGHEAYRSFHDVGAKLTNPVKALVTGYNPLFAISNMLRDIPTYLIQSKHNIFKSVSGLGKAIGEMATDGKIYEMYKAMGNSSSGYYHQGKGFSDSLGVDKGLVSKAYNGMKGILSMIGEGTETIPRLGEFINSLEKYGSSKEGIIKALNDSAEVTVNFSRTAPITKVADGWVLYLNAAVQGLDKFARTVKAHPMRTLARSGAVITAPYATLMAYNWGNPYYQSLNERTKQNYFCIPNMAGEKDSEGRSMTFIKVPVNREYGALLGSSLDVMAGYLSGEENPLKGYDETLATNFMPPSPLTDNILSPIALNLPNNEDFAGRKIVPTSMENASPKNQYDANTSGLGKGIANVGNYLSEHSKIADKLIPDTLKSPMKVDYLIDSYGGYAGSVAKAATSTDAKDVKSYLTETMLKGVAIDPFERRFTADSRYSSGAISDFYDELDKINTEKADDKLEGNKADSNTTLSYVKGKVYNEISKQLTDLSKEEKDILGSNILSPKEKTRKINLIRTEKNNLARSAKEKAKEAAIEYNESPTFASLDKNVKTKYTNVSKSMTKNEFAKAYNSQKEYDSYYAKAVAMISNGADTYKKASAINKGLHLSSYNKSVALINAGFTADEVERLTGSKTKKKIDTDKNGYQSKSELMSYINSQGGSSSDKRSMFTALAPSNWNNPY